MPALTSYGNPGGVGNRTASIAVTAGVDGPVPGPAQAFVDGSLAYGNSYVFINTPAGHRILFDFSALGARIIDEFTLHKFFTPTGWGTVQFRGSLDGVDWDNLGAPLAVGTGDKYVHPLGGNENPYLYYDLLHTVASGDVTVEIQEIDFKIASPCEPHARTSYVYPGGVGDRRPLIAVSGTAVMNVGGALDSSHDGFLINGAMDLDNRWFVAGQSGVTIEFDFTTLGPQKVTAFTWWQGNTTTQGDWVFEGHDGSAWLTLAGPFALGNPRMQEIAVADSGYRTRYRLRQVAGVTSSSPALNEIEFELGPQATADAPQSFAYGNAGGSGDRSPLVAVTANFSPFSGNVGNLVDGDLAADANGSFGYENLTTQTAKITFSFAAIGPQAIAEFRFFRNNPINNWGTWQFRGSSDGVNYVNLGDPVILGGTQRRYHNTCNQLAYPFYQLAHVAGTLTGQPWLQEIDFRIGGEPYVPTLFPHTVENASLFGAPAVALTASAPPLEPATVENENAFGDLSLSQTYPAPVNIATIQGH